MDSEKFDSVEISSSYQFLIRFPDKAECTLVSHNDFAKDSASYPPGTIIVANIDNFEGHSAVICHHFLPSEFVSRETQIGENENIT